MGSLPWCGYMLLLVYLFVALRRTICFIVIISDVLTIEQGHASNVFQHKFLLEQTQEL